MNMALSRDPSSDRPVDISSALRSIALAGAGNGQPVVLFDAVEGALKEIVGHKLFTLLLVHHGGELERIYTNMPESYPVKGRKKMGPTPWGKHVLDGQKPYLGCTLDDIRWAFFDHALIESLGCGSVINSLVCWDGELLGVVNMLHEEHHYDENDLVIAAPFAQLLAPAFMKLIDGD